MEKSGDNSQATSASNPQIAKIERDAYIWNTASGFLMAFQSVFMLMVLTRVCDMATAGIFTIAYANANLFLNIGKYGMRNYQASDIHADYSYRAYAQSRVVTTAAMIAIGIAYLIASALTLSYSFEKTAAIAVMTLFKAANAVEDVYMGNCQQHGRLDIAAKALTWRAITTIIVFCALIAVMGELLCPLCIATVYTFAFCAGEYIWMRRNYNLPQPDSDGSNRVLPLLKACFPVFLATFLLFYIGNAPKYAIDALMDDSAQAYYGFIAMPVFIVSLLASFIYNPIIVSLAENWHEGKNHLFLRRLGMQSLYIVGITIACDLAALIAGIPVLGLLYNTDLSDYLGDLLILITGGGFLALATLFTTGITIIRRQRSLFFGYIAATALAAVGSYWAVDATGIDGASWIYLIVMAFLALWFGIVLVRGSLRK